jgi:hypothetical protein
MDTNGNLTSPAEFDGVTIQLVSYQPSPNGGVSYLGADVEFIRLVDGQIFLNPDVCLQLEGAPNPPAFGQFLAASTGSGGFTLALTNIQADLSEAGFSGIYLSWSGQGRLILAPVAEAAQPGAEQVFNVDFLQGDCWFSLYASDEARFASVSGIDAEGRPEIAAESWSNDPTQIWRAQVVASKFVTADTSAALPNADTPAAPAPADPSKSGTRD